jgi:hypothetical protein
MAATLGRTDGEMRHGPNEHTWKGKDDGKNAENTVA